MKTAAKTIQPRKVNALFSSTASRFVLETGTATIRNRVKLS